MGAIMLKLAGKIVKMGDDEVARLWVGAASGNRCGGFHVFRSKMHKPFKTIREQIQILNERGMETDSSTASALLREGYYSIINGYKEPFLFQRGKDEKYKRGTTFSEVYRLFSFDRALRIIVFKYLLLAESSLKTISAYKFAEAFPSDHKAYLDPDSYRNGGWYDTAAVNLTDVFKGVIDTNNGFRKKPKLYIEHYLQKYGAVPIWVLLNCMTFSNAIQFYKCQKDPIRPAITRSFLDSFKSERGIRAKVKPRDFGSLFDRLKDARNICAHDERLYCARIPSRSDFAFAKLIEGLDVVLTLRDSNTMKSEIIDEMVSCLHDINTLTPQELFGRMGITSLDDLVAVV